MPACWWKPPRRPWAAPWRTPKAKSRRWQRRDYRAALARLAALREPVDTFFADVMVNVDDAAVRANRYALLAKLRGSFLGVADISLLG